MNMKTLGAAGSRPNFYVYYSYNQSAKSTIFGGVMSKVSILSDFSEAFQVLQDSLSRVADSQQRGQIFRTRPQIQFCLSFPFYLFHLVGG